MLGLLPHGCEFNPAGHSLCKDPGQVGLTYLPLSSDACHIVNSKSGDLLISCPGRLGTGQVWVKNLFKVLVH